MVTPSAAPAAAGVSGDRRRYLPGLDGLRAVAVMAVLFAHVGYYVAPGGFVGVDVFFVLSGYLITSILTAEHERTGRVSLRLFYLRRALRLYPALIVAVLLALGLIHYTYEGSLTRWAREAALSVTYLMDVSRSLGYPSVAEVGPLGINWTLAIEEHFYLIWPTLLIALLGAGGRSLAAKSALVIAALSWVGLLASYAGGVNPDHLYFRPDLRCAGLFLGCALSLLIHKIPRDVFRWGMFPATLVLLALIQAAGGNTGWSAWAGRLPLTWLVSLVLVGAIATDSGGLVGRALAWAPIAYVGRISYGIYAYHLILITTLANLDTRFSVFLLGCVAAPILLAAASFHLVELPFLRLKDRLHRDEKEPA